MMREHQHSLRISASSPSRRSLSCPSISSHYVDRFLHCVRCKKFNVPGLCRYFAREIGYRDDKTALQSRRAGARATRGRRSPQHAERGHGRYICAAAGAEKEERKRMEGWDKVDLRTVRKKSLSLVHRPRGWPLPWPINVPALPAALTHNVALPAPTPRRYASALDYTFVTVLRHPALSAPSVSIQPLLFYRLTFHTFDFADLTRATNFCPSSSKQRNIQTLHHTTACRAG